MKRIVLIASIIVILLSAALLMHTQRLQETIQLWDKYNILYLSDTYSETEIESILHDSGITGIITKNKSAYTVKNRMLPTLKPYENEGFTSDDIRDFFFKDKSGTYFLLYVPEEKLADTSSALSKAHVQFGLDATAEYPALCPILCAAVFILLMLINRIDFTKAICLVPLIAVSYAVPFYSTAASICCFLFVFCIADLYDSRTGAVAVILKKTSLYLAMLAGLISMTISGKKTVLLMLAGIVFSIILLNVRWFYVKLSKESYHFKPVQIITARWIDSSKRYNLKTLLTLLTACISFLILSLFSGILNTGIKTQDLLLPSPSEYTEEKGFTVTAYNELSDLHTQQRNPDLSDFLNEQWYAETAAYRKVNAPYTTATGNEKIMLPSFEEEEGLIIEKDKTLFSFDNAYLSSATAEYAEKQGIEKLLVSQDSFFTTDYASTGKMETSPLNIPATVVCVLCFMILAVVYLLKRHKKW